MPLQRLLQTVIAALAAMGTMLLGMGQRDVGMTLTMILAAGLSVWLTDVKGWVYLNRSVANLIMLGAALFSLRDLFNIYNEMQALNFAQFLIYLQIILLFQKKDARINWLLIMLSLLQVVVAALFSQGLLFGILLVLYMLLACLALTLFLLNRQGAPPRTKFPRFSLFGNAVEKTPPPTAAEPAKNGKTVPASRWPLLDRQPEFESVAAGGNWQGVCGELFHRLAGMSVRTLGLTMVLFVVMPRFGQIGWRGGITQPTATVGFNDKVTLGEMGQIIESPSEVMRVRFFENKTDVPYSTSGEIYLYGGLLMDYDKGQWKGIPATTSIMGGDHLQRIPGRKLPKSYVAQKCDIESLDHEEVFFIAPYIPIEDNVSIFVDEVRGRLTRENSLRTRKFSYRLGTTAFINGIQSPLTPKSREIADRVLAATAFPKAKNGEPALKKLQALTDEWIAESKLPPEQVEARARFLESKLAYSGLFKYSLEGQTRNPELDPIEDFLTVHRAGHCEYFATALTLMLRHAGIPARLVVGYKCDEWHEAEGCYQVRQLHAHTWVQAYLKYEQLPKRWLHGEDYFDWKKQGGWLRLDPTPVSEEKTNPGFFSPITKGLQWLDFAWSYYVVELNYERQRKAIFTPLAAAAEKTFETLGEPQNWRSFFEQIGEALQRNGTPGALAWFLVILAALASLALLALSTVAAWRIGKIIRQMIAAKLSKRRREPRIEVEFYRRLESLLAKNGLKRPLGQTPREFAGVAGEWLSSRTGEHRLLPLPGHVVEAYYHVRFGRQLLDDQRSQEVEQILREMEGQLASRKLQTAN